MNKDNHFKPHENFYEMWMAQSKTFFETADKNLREMFGNDVYKHPEAHLDEINKWLDSLKAQWEQNQYLDGQKIYQDYWKFMHKLCHDAADTMMREWIKRSRDRHYVKNIHDLYELWLRSCSDSYKKSLESVNGHDTYAEFMNQAIKFWQSYMPK